MNTQKGFSSIAAIVALLALVGAAYLFIKSEPVSKPTENVEQNEPITPVQTENRITTKMGVSLVLPAGWAVETDTPAETLLDSDPSVNLGDRIYITQHETAKFADFDAKFGPFTLEHDPEQACWLVTESNGKSENVTTCATQEDRLVDGRPAFRTTQRWLTYVVVRDKNVFVEFNMTGSGDTAALGPLLDSVKFE